MLLLGDLALGKTTIIKLIIELYKKNGKKTEMQVKEGDRVIYSQYSGTDVKLEDEEYIIVNQSDIIAIVE